MKVFPLFLYIFLTAYPIVTSPQAIGSLPVGVLISIVR